MRDYTVTGFVECGVTLSALKVCLCVVDACASACMCVPTVVCKTMQHSYIMAVSWLALKVSIQRSFGAGLIFPSRAFSCWVSRLGLSYFC